MRMLNRHFGLGNGGQVESLEGTKKESNGEGDMLKHEGGGWGEGEKMRLPALQSGLRLKRKQSRTKQNKRKQKTTSTMCRPGT